MLSANFQVAITHDCEQELHKTTGNFLHKSDRVKERLQMMRDACDENALAMLIFDFADNFNLFNVKKSKTSICLKMLLIDSHVGNSNHIVTSPIAIGKKWKHKEVGKFHAEN